MLKQGVISLYADVVVNHVTNRAEANLSYTNRSYTLLQEQALCTDDGYKLIDALQASSFLLIRSITHAGINQVLDSGNKTGRNLRALTTLIADQCVNQLRSRLDNGIIVLCLNSSKNSLSLSSIGSIVLSLLLLHALFQICINSRSIAGVYILRGNRAFLL